MSEQRLQQASLWTKRREEKERRMQEVTRWMNGIHWSKPQLAMTQNQMLRREPEGNWSYQYLSLIDPKSTDSSYMTITDSPYLYYVRMDK
jgi:hypothetical protein